MKSTTVTLPAGKTCTGGTGNCVLQWSWFATNDGGSYFGMADINIQAGPAPAPGPTPGGSANANADDVKERKEAAGGMIAIGVIFVLVIIAATVAADAATVLLMLRLLCFGPATDKTSWKSVVVEITRDVSVGYHGEMRDRQIPALVLSGIRAVQLLLAFITMIIAAVGTDKLGKLEGIEACGTVSVDSTPECRAFSLKWSHDFIVMIAVFWIIAPVVIIASQLVSLFVLKKSLDFDETYARIIKVGLGAIAGPVAFTLEMFSIFFLVLSVAAAGESGALVRDSDAIASSIFGAMLLLTLMISQAASLALSIAFVMQMLPHSEDEEGDEKGAMNQVSKGGNGQAAASSPVNESRASTFMRDDSEMGGALDPNGDDVVTALFDYTPGDDATEPELSFRTGDLIKVLSKDDEGWWMGSLNGMTGLFPSNYTSGGQ